MAQPEVLAWLDQATPEQMHCVAMTWNWDFGLEIIEKIIRSSQCDTSTAIISFFNGVDGGTSIMSSSPETALVIEIADRLKHGFYRSRNLTVACHPTDHFLDPRHIQETIATYGPASAWALPSWAFDTLDNAKAVDCSNYDEGNPPGLLW